MSDVLSVVQGDTLEVLLEIGGKDASGIEKIVFCSKDQNIIREFTEYEEGVYFLRIESEITNHFIPRVSSYDITMTFSDGEKVTGSYHNKLIVLRKYNKIE